MEARRGRPTRQARIRKVRKERGEIRDAAAAAYVVFVVRAEAWFWTSESREPVLVVLTPSATCSAKCDTHPFSAVW